MQQTIGKPDVTWVMKKGKHTMPKPGREWENIENGKGWVVKMYQKRKLVIRLKNNVIIGGRKKESNVQKI